MPRTLAQWRAARSVSRVSSKWFETRLKVAAVLVKRHATESPHPWHKSGWHAISQREASVAGASSSSWRYPKAVEPRKALLMVELRARPVSLHTRSIEEPHSPRPTVLNTPVQPS